MLYNVERWLDEFCEPERVGIAAGSQVYAVVSVGQSARAATRVRGPAGRADYVVGEIDRDAVRAQVERWRRLDVPAEGDLIWIQGWEVGSSKPYTDRLELVPLVSDRPRPIEAPPAPTLQASTASGGGDLASTVQAAVSGAMSGVVSGLAVVVAPLVTTIRDLALHSTRQAERTLDSADEARREAVRLASELGEHRGYLAGHEHGARAALETVEAQAAGASLLDDDDDDEDRPSLTATLERVLAPLLPQLQQGIEATLGSAGGLVPDDAQQPPTTPVEQAPAVVDADTPEDET